MSLSGHVENGVVVFDAGLSLPDGTKVTILPLSGGPSAIQSGTGDWTEAAKAAQVLRDSGYDLDAWKQQRDSDLKHAADHLP